MKLYSVLIKKNKEEKVEDVIILKDGFIWSAFIFSGLWFLYYKMWKEFLALLCLNLVLTFFDKVFSGFDAAILHLMLAALIAFNANFWLENHLKKLGYEMVGSIFGESEIKAKVRLMESLKLEFDPKEFVINDQIISPKIRQNFARLRKLKLT